MKKMIAALTLAGLALPPSLAFANEAELSAKLERLAAEVEALRAELARVKTQQTVMVAPVATSAAGSPAAGTPAAGTTNAVAPVALVSPAASEQETTLFGYGEMNYNRPKGGSADTQFDVRRAVLGIAHRFSPTTRMAMELEVEHAVVSASDKGEIEVEQIYVDQELSTNLGLQAGLMLMPAGLINRNHEPTAYYGVERNFVETAIIPSTWREAGVALHGNTDNGLNWSGGITTGFDLTKWDATSTDGQISPLASIHQEGQQAHAHDPSLFGSIEYTDIPGLLLGGFAFTGKASQKQPGFAAPSARVTLWDLHSRWTPGKWDLAALVTRGTISNTQDLNLTLVGNPTLVPKAFYGWYAQAAYHLWSNGDASLSPFVRYERFNTGAAYEELPAGLSVAALPTEHVTTVGLSYKINANIVVKTDYQKFGVDSTRDRLNLGMGYAF